MLPDLHIDFSRGRSGGLVFPSLSEFSTVVVIHTVKGFGIVNKAAVDVFLELSCFVDDLKDGLKLYIQKTKIMVSGPITSWQIDGETVETVADFIFLDSKITADGDCSHEIKRSLLL